MKLLFSFLVLYCFLNLSFAEIPKYKNIQIQARGNLTDGYNLPMLSSFNSDTAVINESGTVISRVLLMINGFTRWGFWAGKNGHGNVIYLAPSEMSLSEPVFTKEENLIFQIMNETSTGVFHLDYITGETSRIINTGGSYKLKNFGDLYISSKQEIYFRAWHEEGNSYMCYSNGKFQQKITDNLFEPTSPYSYLFAATFNNRGELAAKVRLGRTGEIDDSQPDRIILFNPENQPKIIAVDFDESSSSRYLRFNNRVTLNDKGHMAFIAENLENRQELLFYDGEKLKTVATSGRGGIEKFEYFPVAFNNNDLMAFRAYDSNGIRGIFLSNGSEVKPLIKERDIVTTDKGPARITQHDGSPALSGGVSLNNKNQIVFSASLTPIDDNQIEWGTGIFVASPETSKK